MSLIYVVVFTVLVALTVKPSEPPIPLASLCVMDDHLTCIH